MQKLYTLSETYLNYSVNMVEDPSLPLSPISELMQRYQGPNLEPEYAVHKVDGSDHCPV